ncbi:hypothetical protein M0R45_007472 [Rubus argutus]|uniref:F-box domain-containing protein n=1 Tax=Rubus argutus TaxID=59490 RepID=A0AAW1XZ60_RUBAR
MFMSKAASTSLRLSLNSRDEIHASSPDDSLASLAVCPNAQLNVSDSEVFVPEIEIFEFWRIVKDGITYPLLIDLCAKAGLAEPPSLMCLPSDLKMNTLDRLLGVDIARVGCACKELQNLANNDELWKHKF